MLVDVWIVIDGMYLLLSVIDDGIGFVCNCCSGYGFVGMCVCCEVFGGSFEMVMLVIGCGMCVIVCFVWDLLFVVFVVVCCMLFL